MTMQRDWENFNISQFNQDLIRWFYKYKRDLPWRQTKNPYYIWVSEVMLQQTQVDTVIPYYQRFITKFPTPQDLASADEEAVLKIWEGLGYYSRARNLQQGVREVVENYQGRVPDNKNDILSIKGIGPYTAGAVLSIAYDRPEPAVDGNVMRVLSRVFLIDDDIAKQKTRRLFEEIIYRIIPESDPSAFNQGLMEIGALICKPKQAKCEQCPLAAHCGAYEEGVQTEYPVKKKKTPPKPLHFAVLVLKNQSGEYLIRKRPEKGLLAKLWEFPMIPLESPETSIEESVRDYIEKNYSAPVKINDVNINIQHTFTHLKWHLSLFAGSIEQRISAEKDEQWASLGQLEKFPFPVSHQKIVDKIKQGLIS
ncbi:A/G-specific adenine glycosylase [Scopulibacillus daqui]|uniref:Adenine DNA glycosylase n=1 Tax=Scopulibacillus daqui TaxID=1469162 RepID=A0ABS2PYY9_9BACL|nr:A/G-specific adenine glycosylase [Scopulibacillus daqui]MBM7645158.1 A/G-specific adenine glycosylase [Scopulibacillus daqui]